MRPVKARKVEGGSTLTTTTDDDDDEDDDDEKEFSSATAEQGLQLLLAPPNTVLQRGQLRRRLSFSAEIGNLETMHD